MNTGLTYQMRWAWSLTKGYRSELFWYFIIELAAIFLSLAFVYWSKQAVDFAIAKDSSALKEALILSAVCLLLAMFGRIFSRWLNERTRIAMLSDLQNSVTRNQMMASWKVVKQLHSGDIQVRIHSDCKEIVYMIGYSWLSFMLTTIRLLASFGFLWSMDPMLALLILAISPLLIFSKVYFKKLRKLNTDTKEAESVFGNVLQENLRFRLSIRVLGMHRTRWAKTKGSQEQLVRLKKRLLNFSTLSQGMVKLVMNAGFLLTFVWGVYRLYTNEISFGTMTAFLQLVGRVQAPMLGMMAFVPLFIRFRTSVQRVQELMNVDIEEEEEAEIISTPKAIRVAGLTFGYEDRLVIDNLHAVMRVGKPTALLGASGKGKTTFIRLLLALLDPDSGQIDIHADQRLISLKKKHRANMAYVPQGDKLFTGTIRENLAIGEVAPTMDDIKRVLYIACAEFVYGLPNGLDTYIGESGYGLSEGQAQRIAIARALLNDCSIWIFDEVTSALDEKTSDLLMDRLLEAGDDKILIFATHDMALANNCDEVIYIK
ncbi:ABC transporter ATP-binding protein [Albibacterium indicum]|uniref:ABC transporter ATP-binding protein n=1 Tax=Albibacterium indicum TaxID=2292082 RepID=UPI000E51E028|nr:ABC transporter ATP-binding protein [Pedobacter indicus]